MLTDEELKIKFDILSNKLKVGLFDDVITEAKILLKKRKHQVIFNILSLAYQNIGEFQKSVDVMDEALHLNANNPYFLNNMGISQHKLQNFLEAEKFLKRGLEVAPNYINLLNNLANLKKDLNFTEEAINYYKKSILIKKDLIETNLNIAFCYQSIGKYKESTYHLNEVLKINPKATISDRLISSMKKYERNDPHLKDMESKIKKTELNDEQLSHLYFGLGKAYDDLKEFDKSFHNYDNGNRLLKKLIPFNIEVEKKIFDKIKKFFSDNKKINFNSNMRKIIFIVGMPRSGTSLVEQILSSHRNVYGGGELSLLTNIINKNFLKKFKDNSLGQIPELNDLISESNNEYMNKIQSLDRSNKDFTDKTPLNFKFVGFIKNIFPNSKIIHCKRNALDTAWSNYKNYFPGSLPFTNDLIDLAGYYNIYNNLMRFWESKFHGDIYNIEYEKLVINPKVEIENILKFCDLAWDENCIKHEKNTRPIKTASVTQAREPIYKSAIKSANNYENYLHDFIKNLEN